MPPLMPTVEMSKRAQIPSLPRDRVGETIGYLVSLSMRCLYTVGAHRKPYRNRRLEIAKCQMKSRLLSLAPSFQ